MVNPMNDASEQKPSVLVVEDDEHIGPLLEFMLERQGYRVELRTDGRAARQFIETNGLPPSLILLDVMLPFHDGFELLRMVRAQPGWETVPLVMLTAKNSELDIARALDAGANDYILKPFQPADLMARLRRFMPAK
jgi:DNA-binding response OmpR family regulator